MAGLLCTLAAAVLAFFPRQVKSKKLETLLRSEYERFFSDPRSFEFDEIGWKYKSGRGEDVREWSELTSLRDSSGVMVLGTSGGVYLLPKSAFATEDLERIKELSDKALDAPGALFKVRISSSVKDYVLSMVSYNWRRNWRTALLSYAAALVLLVAVTYPSAEYSLIDHPVIMAFVFGLCFLGECLYYVYLYHQGYRKDASTIAAVMGDRIGFWTPTGRWIVKYQWLSEIRETGSSFHLYFQPTSFYLIPKKELDREQLTRFREILLSKRVKGEESTLRLR